MRRNLLIYFTPAELASLLKLFDRDGSGKINCALFLQHFWNIGRMEHDKHIHDHIRTTHRKNEAETKRKDAIKEKYGKLVEVKVVQRIKLKKLQLILQEKKHFLYQLRNVSKHKD